jgi:hypothetical protein
MPTRHQRARQISEPLTAWCAKDKQRFVVTRGELMSVLASYDAAQRENAWHRRLWRYLTRPARA